MDPAAAIAASRPLGAGFIGEGVLGHRTVQAQLERLVGSRDDVVPWFETVGRPGRFGSLFVRPFDALAGLDFHAVRWRLRWSFAARALLRRHIDRTDAVFIDSQSCALAMRRELRRVAGIVSVDVTGRQFARLEYHQRSRFKRVSDLPAIALERRALSDAAVVMAWTDWAADSLRTEYGIDERRIAVLHPGVDAAPLLAIDRGESRSERVGLLFLGNDVRRKGLEELFAALPMLPPSVELDVVTTDPVDAGERVHVHRGLAPGTPAMIERMRSADVLVLPSRADAAPLAVLEGMAAGLPVVSTNVAAIPELVGDAGLLVPPRDPAALAGAVSQLVSDRQRREWLGRRARERVRARYDAQVQVPRLLELMRTAAESGSER